MPVSPLCERQVYRDAAACHGEGDAQGKGLAQQGVEYHKNAVTLGRGGGAGEDMSVGKRRGGGALGYGTLCRRAKGARAGGGLSRSASPVGLLLRMPVAGGEEEEEGGEEGEGWGGEREGGGVHHGYVMRENIGVGGYGEVWRAKRDGVQGGGEGGCFVLKRLFVERGEAVRMSGLREAHFGVLLQGVPHVCRWVKCTCWLN